MKDEIDTTNFVWFLLAFGKWSNSQKQDIRQWGGGDQGGELAKLDEHTKQTNKKEEEKI